MVEFLSLRQEMVDICKSAYTEHLFAGTSGNLSVYRREEGVMLVTPTCVRYETMVAEDIVAIKLDGTQIDGRYAPSSEWRMHAAIYKGNEQVNAVFHTHSPYATAFAVVRRDIPLILIEMIPFLGGHVPCSEFAQPGSWELGASAVDALNKHTRNACLLANHGVVAVGEDLAQAYIRAEYVEDAAVICHRAMQLGDITTIG